jgi:hypothetical protein
VIPTILRTVRLRAVGHEPEPIRRRAITFVPARDTTVVVDAFKERPADPVERAPVTA